MGLIQIRDAIVDTIARAGLGDAVERCSGRLTMDDLETLAVHGRSRVLVGCLGASEVRAAVDGCELEVDWIAYVLAVDPGQGTGEAEAADLAAAVAVLTAGNLWGRTDLDDPTRLRADNLYSGRVRNRGLAMWAITWRQQWTPAAETLSTLDDLLRVVATWQIEGAATGSPQPIDTIELAGGDP